MQLLTCALIIFNLLLLYMVWTLSSVNVEKFSGERQQKINKGLNSILACNIDKTCPDRQNKDKDIIITFQDFKRVLHWPNFNVLLFVKLLKKREDKKSDLTEAEINAIVMEGKFEDSFKEPASDSTPTPKPTPTSKSTPATPTPSTPQKK